MTFSVRDLKTYDEMLNVHKLQQQIWRQADPTIGLYPPVMSTAAKNGGVVLGAFDDQSGQMIGFLFSFLGRASGGPLKLCSQAMGVAKKWRGQRVGEALKLIQRQRVLDQDLELVTWTYDPMEGPNAHLNLHKLRAISRTYLRDIYGSTFGALNAGLPTDRLLVEWWLTGSRLQTEVDDDEELFWDSPSIFEVKGQGAGRRIIKSDLSFGTGSILLETPADIHPVKEENLELALDWRLKVRNAFEKYFAKGFIATDFISVIERGERRNRYLLQKETPQLRAAIGIEYDTV